MKAKNIFFIKAARGMQAGLMVCSYPSFIYFYQLEQEAPLSRRAQRVRRA